jgi:tetratricopeptide (TPR) repeat protein
MRRRHRARVDIREPQSTPGSSRSGETMKPATSVDVQAIDVLESYLAELRSGKAPDRRLLLRRHPELAAELERALMALDFIHDAEQTLRSAPTPPSGSGGPVLAADAATSAPQLVLGDYRLLRELGRGGMAVVYEAEQVSLRRKVALKVLPLAGVLDSNRLQRFQNEAQAAAHLQHPNIVPVYAVGCDAGVHYYAMQYVEGQSLAARIADRRSALGSRNAGEQEATLARAAPARCSREGRLWYSDVARLALQAAAGLDHAHQLGVVHRDVKPGNLLVDAAGHLWIVDFGLARFAAGADLTTTGELLGTVRYMSPEQAQARRAPIDHRTDVYALGATLYELCTLQPAFPGDDPRQVLDDIVRREPRPPRRLDPALPRDLETIVLKAMEKDAARRYATAQEMAEDLARFLDDRTVLARRPSLAARAARWSRRHRPLVAAASAVLFLLMMVLAVAAAWIAQEERRTSAALARAERNLDSAHQAVTEFLVQMGIRDRRDAPLPSPARRALLDKALLFYRSFLLDRRDPDAHVERGDILIALNHDQEALAAYDQALGLDRLHVKAHVGRGIALDGLGRPDEALSAFGRAVEIRPGHAEAYFHRGSGLRERGHLDAALADLDRALALTDRHPWAHNNRGLTLHALGKPDAALEAFARSIDVHPMAVEPHLNRAAVLNETGRHDEALLAVDRAIALEPDGARGHYNRAIILENMKRLDDAVRAYDQAVAADPKLMEAHLNRGALLADLGRNEESLRDAEQACQLAPGDGLAHFNRGCALAALEQLDEALGAFDRSCELTKDAVESSKIHFRRSSVLRRQGRSEDALAALDQALTGDPRPAQVNYERGVVLAELGRKQDAVNAYAAAVATDGKHALACHDLGAVLLELQRFQESLAASDRAIDLDGRRATAHFNRGCALVALHEAEQALEAFGRAVELDGRLVHAHFNMGCLLADRNNHRDALTAYERALAVDDHFGPAHANRGSTLIALGQHDEALASCERALECGYRPAALLNEVAWRRATTANPALRDVAKAVRLARAATEAAADQGPYWNTLGVALCGAGEWQEALDALDRSMDLRSGGDARDWFFVAMAHWHLGRKDAARQWHEKAAAWSADKAPQDEELQRFRREAAALLGID